MKIGFRALVRAMRLRGLAITLACLLSAFWAVPALAAAPANDDFANAVALDGSVGTVSGTTVGATNQFGEWCYAEQFGCGGSVWYTWQTPATTTTIVSFDTCVSDYDSTLQVYTGNSLATLQATLLVEDGGNCGLGGAVHFDAVPGTTYSVRVSGDGPYTGTFQLKHCETADYHVLCSSNTPPDCSAVAASPSLLTASGKQLQQVTLAGTTDLDGDTLSFQIDSATQDEPVTAKGDDTSPDAATGTNSNQVRLRSEANPQRNGRVYRVAYTVSDGNGGTCTGVEKVSVARKREEARRSGRAALVQVPITRKQPSWQTSLWAPCPNGSGD
jgi:hypothetical protein